MCRVCWQCGSTFHRSSRHAHPSTLPSRPMPWLVFALTCFLGDRPAKPLSAPPAWTLPYHFHAKMTGAKIDTHGAPSLCQCFSFWCSARHNKHGLSTVWRSDQQFEMDHAKIFAIAASPNKDFQPHRTPWNILLQHQIFPVCCALAIYWPSEAICLLA